jgi:hypothetical protein
VLRGSERTDEVFSARTQMNVRPISTSTTRIVDVVNPQFVCLGIVSAADLLTATVD